MENSKEMLISVIVTTYNRPSTLDKVLDSLNDQTDTNFEIIIADDGSTNETRELISKWKIKSDIPIIHAWQEDLGFRAATSRNNGIRHAHGDYLIFIDGDCLLRSNFVEQHRLLMEDNYVVAGNRCLLSPELSSQIENGKISIKGWGWSDFFLARIMGKINRLSALMIFSPKASFRYKSANNWEKVRSCNMAVFKTDIDAVNGFDESFIGWGFEDSDLAVRLINFGLKVKRGSFATTVLHLYHPETVEDQSGPNWDRFQYVLKNRGTQPIKGLT